MQESLENELIGTSQAFETIHRDLLKEFALLVNHHIGFFQGNRLVGYIRANEVEENGDCHISHFIIHPDYRGRHLSIRFFEEALIYLYAQGAKRVWSNVLKKNETILAVLKRRSRLWFPESYMDHFKDLGNGLIQAEIKVGDQNGRR